MANHEIQWDLSNGNIQLFRHADAVPFIIGNTTALMSRVPVAFQCERHGTMTAGHFFAWANGSIGHGGAMPYAGKMVCASLSVTGSAAAETVTCQLAKNGAAQGVEYQLAVTGNGGTVSTVNQFATPLVFAAGDEINFINLNATVTAPTTTTGIFLVIFD